VTLEPTQVIQEEPSIVVSESILELGIQEKIKTYHEYHRAKQKGIEKAERERKRKEKL